MLVEMTAEMLVQMWVNLLVEMKVMKLAELVALSVLLLAEDLVAPMDTLMAVTMVDLKVV